MTVADVCEPFVVAGISAMFASCCIHPIDLAKVRLQLHTTINPGTQKVPFFKVLTGMIKNEGFLSIYSGLSASLLRQAVYGTSRLGLHRTFSNELQKRNDGKPISYPLKVCSGMASGAIAVCLGTPCDVALVRMQADSMEPPARRRGYKNAIHAVFRIFKEEGVLRLYSGLLPNVLRGMSVNVGMMAMYDQAREMIQEARHEDMSPQYHGSRSTQLMASGIAGFTTSFLSLPFDQIKSRLQQGNHYTGIRHVVKTIVKKEGIMSFWTGFGAYYLRTAPHAMIVLVCMEPVRKYYYKVFESDIDRAVLQKL